MRYPTQILVSAVLALALIGCEQTETTSPNGLEAAAVSFDLTNAPPTSGYIVSRGETECCSEVLPALNFLFTSDDKNGLWIMLGREGFICPAPEPDIVAFQNVDVPDRREDTNRVVELIKGELTAGVYSDFFDMVFCENAVATGVVSLINTDNDVLTFETDENENANAFGWNAHGKVTLSSGESARLAAHSRCEWDGIDDSTLACSDRIVVR